MADLFISYAREDKSFVAALHDAFRQRERDVWVDWEDIPLTAEWWREIQGAIEAADCFAFIISPDSIASETCAKEIEYAVALHKRLIPIVRREVADGVPAPLAKINWIMLRECDDFASGVAGLLQSLDTDLDWLHAHTRLLVQAIEWDRKGRPRSSVLRRADLRTAEEWLVKADAGRAPSPTALQREYVLASRRAAIARLWTFVGLSLCAVLLIAAAAVVAWQQRNEAIRQRDLAVARQLAAQADLARTRHNGVEESVELALQALQAVRPHALRSFEADLAMRRGLALLARRRPAFQLDGLGNAVSAVFSRDGRYLTVATAHLDGTVWDSVSQQPVPWDLDGTARAVALSPDGKYLAAAADAGQGGRVRVWRLADQQETGGIDYTGSVCGFVHAIALSPNATFLALKNCHDDTATVWHLASGRAIATVARASDPVFSPSGRWAAIGRRLWEITGVGSDAELKEVQHYKRTFEFAFSPDDQYLAGAGADGSVTVWSLPDGREVGAVKYDGNFETMAVSAHGEYVAVAGRDYTVQVLDVATGREAARINHGNGLGALAFNPQTRQLALAGLGKTAQVVEVLNAGSDVVHLSVDGIVGAAFTPSADDLITIASPARTAGAGLVTRGWRTSTGDEVAGLGAEHAGARFALSADGGSLALVGDAGSVQVWDLRARQMRSRQSYEGEASAVALSADGRHLGVATEACAVHLWDLQGAGHTQFECNGTPRQLSVAPEGSEVAALIYDLATRRGEQVRAALWRARGGETQLPLGFVPNQIRTVALSADARYVATADDHEIKIRPLMPGAVAPPKPISHNGEVRDCNFSPDGAYLACAGDAGTARIWEVDDGKEIARLEAPGSIDQIVFALNRKYVATLSKEGLTRIWLLQPEDLIAEACQRLGNASCAAESR